MNKYLEKVASWKDPSKFVGYVTGKRKRDALTKYRNVADFVANKETIEDVAGRAASETSHTTKARQAAGGAAVAGVAAGAYGYKRHRDKQKKETLAHYEAIFKQATVGGASAELARAGGSGVYKILKTVGKKMSDTMNTAGGGKVKEYALQHGVKKKGLKDFMKQKHKDQVRTIAGRGKGEEARKNTRTHSEYLNNLKNHQRDAKITIGSGATAGLTGYAYMKARHQLKKQEEYKY